MNKPKSVAEAHRQNKESYKNEVRSVMRDPVISFFLVLASVGGGLMTALPDGRDDGLKGEAAAQQARVEVGNVISDLQQQAQRIQDTQQDLRQARIVQIAMNTKDANLSPTPAMQTLASEAKDAAQKFREDYAAALKRIVLDPALSEPDSGSLYNQLSSIKEVDKPEVVRFDERLLQECRPRYTGPDTASMMKAVAACTVNGETDASWPEIIAGGAGLSGGLAVLLLSLPGAGWLQRRFRINAEAKRGDLPLASEPEVKETKAVVVIKSKI